MRIKILRFCGGVITLAIGLDVTFKIKCFRCEIKFLVLYYGLDPFSLSVKTGSYLNQIKMEKSCPYVCTFFK